MGAFPIFCNSSLYYALTPLSMTFTVTLSGVEGLSIPASRGYFLYMTIGFYKKTGMLPLPF